MRAALSILIATLMGSVLLQGSLTVWHPSSFGRFSEFPVSMFYAAGIISAAFLLLIVPTFVLLRRAQRRLSWRAGFIIGLGLGCVVMLLFMALFQWPVRIAELVAGSVAGAAGVGTYAALTFKSVKSD